MLHSNMELSTAPSDVKIYTRSGSYVGLCLAISSSIFIGSSFIVKKLSLIRLNKRGSVRAGAGGFGYLTDWMWWLGLLLMGIGEFANFAAYTFAPASLVTPLGALSVLVAAVLASKFLNEKINIFGKLGCVLCILGSTILIIHSPKDDTIVSTDELLNHAQNTAFINYLITITIMVFLILVVFGPKYGSRHVVVYLTLCSAVGSFTVMACKALGMSIKENAALGINQPANYWLPFSLCIIVLLCICLQMNYLNKALDLFSTSVVTPIYYVLFTTLVIIASSILFEEWKVMSGVDMLGAVCGFLVTVVAIFLLNAFKDTSNGQMVQRTNSVQSGSVGSYGARRFVLYDSVCARLPIFVVSFKHFK
ncbi:magnesium transporter NIPA2 isoform X1 [Diabrotica virgifera virgifera]|uniref:Magnesium transporter NIPA2 n=1 Tax=Diabrotica virgifera virgifera TaxID=50390 RepID=A0ABM5K268_DIAVI|nr:magnesium transporter NIPA2 isoform X1 [Diabrotica virgifera virgifera]